MKKIVISIYLFLWMILCCACGSNSNEDIIGYWMRGDGYTISFVDNTTCSLGGGALQTYKIYDENHIQIVDLTGTGVSEFVFDVDGNILKIRLVTEEGYTEFTKDEDEQKKILEKMKEWQNIALEEQMLQTKIDNLKKEISSYRDEMEVLQKEIDWNNSAIDNNKEDIIKWEEEIKQAYIDCQESIAFGDDKEYQENQRDDFVAAYKETIQGCNERIEELEAENIGYQKCIDLILLEIKKLEEIEIIQQ